MVLNMKKRCYPRYSYIIFIVLSTIMLLFSLLPLFIETGETIVIKIIWSIIMLVFCLIFIICAMHNLQYFYIEDDVIIVRSVFGVLTKINIIDVQAYIEILPTYFSWITTREKKWICLYAQNDFDRLSKFKTGCSNKKAHNRIQIIYSEENKKILEKYIHIENRDIMQF